MSCVYSSFLGAYAQLGCAYAAPTGGVDASLGGSVALLELDGE